MRNPDDLSEMLRELHWAVLVKMCRPRRRLKWPQKQKSIRRANYRVLDSQWWRGLSREQQDHEVGTAIIEISKGYRKALIEMFLFPRVVRRLEQRLKEEERVQEVRTEGLRPDAGGDEDDTDGGDRLAICDPREYDRQDEWFEEHWARLIQIDPELARLRPAVLRGADTNRDLAAQADMPLRTLERKLERARRIVQGERPLGAG